MKTIGMVLCLLIAAGSVQAAIMNWDVDGDYPEGGIGSASNPIQAYNNIDGTGVDVSLYWLGETSKFLTSYVYNDGSNSATITLPDDDYSLIFDNLSALWYGLDLDGTVSLVIQFSQQVTNVNFSIWDIDGPLGQAGAEKVRIKGFLGGLGVGAVAPSSYSGGPDLDFTLVPIGSDSQDGLIISNKGLYDINPPAEQHRAFVGFDGPIDTIGYQFTTTQENRGQLLGDISFVPEPATLGLLALGALGVFRRKR